MPVFNAGEYLQEAIASILSQTYGDFEFLVIDDGSTDGSQDIIRSFSDRRIRFVQNGLNQGVAVTLNKGMEMASGEYIARMDGDDISLPHRIETQLQLLEKKTWLGICGSWVKTQNFHGKGHIIRFPLDSETINAYIVFNNPVNHPVVMMRRDMLVKHQLRYNPACIAAQDYEFWSRCLHCFDFENIDKVLLVWRINNSGVTHRNFSASNSVAINVQKRELQRLGIDADEQELEYHRDVGNSVGVKDLEKLAKARVWLERLILHNEKSMCYPHRGLERAAAMVWFNLCVNSSGIGISVPREYRRASFRRHYIPPLDHIAYFIINSLLRIRKAPVGELLGSK